MARAGCFFFVFAMLAFVGLAVAVALAWATVGPGSGGAGRGVALVLLAAPLLGVLLLFAIAGRSLRRIAAPLDAMSAAARRLEEGDYSARASEPARAPGALRELVRAFNTMAERLQVDEEQRRSLLADVSHELRTPLTVIRGELEAIQDGVRSADEQQIATLLQEVEVLTRLVDDLRTVALSEAGVLPLHLEPTDLGVVVAEAVESAGTAATASGVDLRADVPEDLPLLDLDPLRLREVVTNLLSNALRYTPEGGLVEVLVSLEGDRVRIAARDSGPGIDAEILPRIFERFAKGRGSPGFGLGLSIARHLVEAHGGTLEAESPPGGGTTMTLSLPTALEAGRGA